MKRRKANIGVCSGEMSSYGLLTCGERLLASSNGFEITSDQSQRA